MDPINQDVEKIIAALLSGLQSKESPGVDHDSVQITRDPKYFAGQIDFTLRHQKWSVGFCLHPHDYPNDFTINGKSDPELPLNTDLEIAESVKKILARVRGRA